MLFLPEDSYQGMPSVVPKADPTVQERRFQRRVKMKN
jgi:hypothetical protein